MQFGRFFSIDKNSIVEEGKIVFRYLRVVSERNPILPIYLSLKPNSIDFYYHTFKEQQLSNQIIISLPLASTLNSGESLDNVLRKLHKKELLLDYPVEKNKPSKWSFANYKEFSVPDFSVNTIYYAQLILDFIQDWQFSKVFEHSPHFDEVNSRLENVFLFNAIADKSFYYYCKLNYLEKDSVFKCIYAKRLYDAERQWLNVIRSDNASDYFYTSGGWFSHAENEYKRVLFWKDSEKRKHWFTHLKNNINNDEKLSIAEKQKSILEIKNKNDILIKSSSNWFLGRYNINLALKTFFGAKYRNLLIIAAISLMALIASFAISFYKQPNISFLVVISLASFLSFIILLSLKSINLLLPRLLMAIMSSWFLLVSSSVWVINYDVNTLSVTIISIITSIVLIAFMTNEIRKIDPYIVWKNRLKKAVIIFFMGLFFSSNIGLIINLSLTPKIITRTEMTFSEIREVALQKSKITIFEKLVSDGELHKFDFLGVPFYIFTKMLIVNIFLALFIGIFIQLLYEDKSVTESL